MKTISLILAASLTLTACASLHEVEPPDDWSVGELLLMESAARGLGTLIGILVTAHR